MAGRSGIVGDVVDGVSERARSAVDGITETIDDVRKENVLLAGINRVKGFFSKNAALRRKLVKSSR